MNQGPQSPDDHAGTGAGGSADSADSAGSVGSADNADSAPPRPARRGGFHLRVLDPLTAYQLRGQDSAPQPTSYVADTLVVRGDNPRTFEALGRAAHEAGFLLEPDEESESDFGLLATAPLTDEQRLELTRVWTRRVRLVPGPENIEVHKPIDIWRLLQAYRAGRRTSRVAAVTWVWSTTRRQRRTRTRTPTRTATRTRTRTRTQIVTPTRTRIPTPTATRTRTATASPSTATPGRGGRQPVNWTARPDAAGTARQGRAPPGGGAARHRCGRAPVARPRARASATPRCSGTSIGLPASRRRPSGRAGSPTRWSASSRSTPATGRSSPAWCARRARTPGSSTSGCSTTPAWSPSGSCCAASSSWLSARCWPPRATPAREPVDVLTMSLGYYHEHPEDQAFDVLLAGPLALLGEYGVAVVVSAGNDASPRPIYPAAFAPYPGGPVADEPGRVPLTAVGALNPDGTIALFSNDGPWVRFLPSRRRAGEHHAHDVRRLPRADQRDPQRSWRAAGRPRPRRLPLRLRGVERHLVRGAGLRRPAGGPPRGRGGAHRPRGAASRSCSRCWRTCRDAARTPGAAGRRGPVAAADPTSGEGMNRAVDAGPGDETLVGQADGGLRALPRRGPRRVRRPRRGDDPADVAHRAGGPGSTPPRPRTSSRPCGWCCCAARTRSATSARWSSGC